MIGIIRVVDSNKYNLESKLELRKD